MSDELESRSANLSVAKRKEEGGRVTVTGGNHVKRTGDKRMRQSRGSATTGTTQNGGRERVLYLIFSTHETHPALHVSRNPRFSKSPRCVFALQIVASSANSLFAEPISALARERVCPLQNSSDYYGVFAK